MHDKIFEVLLKKELDRIFNKFIDIVDQNVGHSIVFKHNNDDDDIFTSMQKAGYAINAFHHIHTDLGKQVGDTNREILKKVNEIRTDFFKDFFL